MFDFKAYGLIESKIKLDLPGNGPQTIAEVLDRQLALDPNKDALIGRSGRYTYGQLDEVVNKACQVFKSLGIEQYDRIAATLPNDVDIIIAFLACARLGAIWVGVNRPLAGPEKAFVLKDSGARLYLADPESAAEIKEHQTQLPELKQCLLVHPGHDDSEWHHLLSKAEAQKEDRNIDPFEPAAIAYTSGTTGLPKGAVHSHHNILLPGAIEVVNKSYGPDCPQGVMLPLTILNLIVLAPMVAFQDGASCVCIDSLKPVDLARWVGKEKIGHFASVPTVIHDLLTSPEVDPADLVSLGHPDIGGAGCPKEVQTLYEERFGRRITIAYGMTEAPTIVSRTDPDKEPETDLCGKAVEHIELLIVDDDNNPLPQGEIGEICVRPAQTGRFAGIYTTMLGYWDRREATEKSLSGGFYHTGDMGYLDKDQQLYIHGRRNELIIRGGANVYPAEVERIMGEHPAVATAAVFGIDDARLGQRVVSAIELNKNYFQGEDKGASQNLSKETLVTLTDAIQQFCLSRLARYKVPETIKIVESLPRNAMNKVIKPKLVDLF